MSALELLHNTPQDDSQNSNGSNTQQFETPSEQTESIWGRLIPVCANHTEATLNQVHELTEPITRLGRDTNNDITLKCKNISSKHCKLMSNNDNGVITVFLEDTSTNGTWIDKKKICKTKVLISDGCEIILVPGSKKRKRKKLSYFFNLEYHKKQTKLSVESKYYIIKDLGSGAFSTVKLVQNRENNDKFALKIIDRHSWQRMKHATNRNVSLLDEVEIMKKANHPGIVKVYEYFEEDTKVNVILDFCGGGDMLEFIQKNGAYSSDKARSLFKQLISSVEYLHSLKIAHRDLKPDNILLTDKNGEILKVSDFGISREQSSSGCGTVIGTPMYQAPEVHNNRDGYDGTLADYWSLGIILYVMLVAAPPISQKENSGRICEMSLKRSLPWYDEPIPETAKDLIYRLLCVDPKKRITAKDIYKHEWMIGMDGFAVVSNGEENNGDCEMKETEECDEYSSNGSNNNNNRKRRAHFDDENDTETNKPPSKKQKSDPGGLQSEDILPIKLTSTPSNTI